MAMTGDARLGMLTRNCDDQTLHFCQPAVMASMNGLPGKPFYQRIYSGRACIVLTTDLATTRKRSRASRSRYVYAILLAARRCPRYVGVQSVQA